MTKPLVAVMILILSVPCVQAGDWKLVWSDEFDVEGLPNSERWDYEEGFIRNRELQYYTRARRQNAWVSDGTLRIVGRKEQYKNPRYQAGSNHWAKKQAFAGYTAASLITKNKASWLYGRIEVRAKLPQGKGMWPAIWMLGTNIDQIGWPRCGEIDIMEFVGKEPNHVHANAHFSLDGKHSSDGGKITTTAPYDDFHVYAIEWTPDTIDFFFDKNRYHRFPLTKSEENQDNPFRKPHYLLINLALGGAWGGPLDDSVLPQEYLIDYVRVYRDAALTKP